MNETEGYSFDLVFLGLFALPLFCYTAGFCFFFKISNVMNWSSIQEQFVLIKLFLLNSFFIFQGFLKEISFNSLMWVIFDEATYGMGTLQWTPFWD